MRPGDVIEDRFEIVAPVAEGGMGLVFRARDRITGAPVAVKVLLEPTPGHTERFLREAKVLGELRHPAIVRYFAHGVASSGDLFLVMQWVEGEDLSWRLTRGALGPAEAIALATRVAEALGTAHALGIVHRDVKPSNILLEGGDVSRPVLVDFGVALQAGAPRRTRTGLVVGTPGYMAPEQARGSRAVDARADVYSLGCVLFECLAGRAPFVGEHAVAVLAKILLEAPPRLRALVPGVPVAVDELCDRLLAKAPEERPADGTTAAALLAACSLEGTGSVRATAAPSLTSDEQRMVHVILAARDDAPDPMGETLALEDQPIRLDTFEESFGVVLERLADGSIVGSAGGEGSAADRVSRAVRAALQLRRAASLPRVVVASGLGRLRGRMPFGEAVDAAAALARRCLQAGETGVFVDPLTVDLGGVRVAVTRRGELARVDAEPTSGPRRASSTMLGRDRELAALLAAREESVGEGEVRVALVTAPPGTGKTRLASEILLRFGAMAPPPRTCEVCCDELSAGSTFGMASQLVGAFAGVDFADSPERRRQRLDVFLASAQLAPDDVARLADFLGEILGAASATEPGVALRAARADAMTMADHVRRAFTDLMRAMTHQPLVIVLDDLQWCDRASMKLLDGALRDLESSPTFVLALARPEVDDRLPGAFEGRAVTRIALGPLAPRASERLVRQRLGADAGDEVVRQVLEVGRGNPLFLEETARGVKEGRAPDASSGTVLAALGARLDTLPAEQRHVLRAASVLGQRFVLSGVCALLGSADRRGVRAHLDDLVGREVLVAPGTASPSQPGADADPEFAFLHTLLRDAAYATLTAEDRALGHRLAVDWLSERRSPDAMLVATHAELGGLLAVAARAYVRAAAQALEGVDFQGVKDRAALALRCGAEGALRGDLEVVVAETCFWMGDLAGCAERARWAMDALPASSEGWFRAGGYAGAALSRLGDAAGVLELTARIRDAPVEGAALEAKVVALCVVAGFLPLQGNAPLAREILDSIELQATTLGARNPQVLARFFRSSGLHAMATGDVPRALAAITRAAALFAEVGDLRNALAQRGNIVNGLLEVGDYEAAVAEGGRLMAEAERLGLRNVTALARQNVGYALVQSGQVEEGIAMLRQARADFAAQGHRRMEGGCHIYLASAARKAGDLRAAEGEARAAIEVLDSTPPLRAYALALLGTARLDAGDVAGGSVAADEAVAIFEQLGGTDAGESEIVLAGARAALATGREARARALLEPARARLLSRAARLPPRERDLFLRADANARLLALASSSLPSGESARGGDGG